MNGVKENQVGKTSRPGYLPLDDETLWGEEPDVKTVVCPIASANRGLCPPDCTECVGLEYYE